MWIFAKDVHASALDAEQFRYVFITVQAVRDEKWNDNHVWRIGELAPVCDQWWFLHVGVAYTGKFAPGANAFCLAFGRDCAVVVQLGSVRNDEKRGLRWRYIGCNFLSPRQQQFSHDRIVADRFAIDPSLAIYAGRNRSVQFQLSRDH